MKRVIGLLTILILLMGSLAVRAEEGSLSMSRDSINLYIKQSYQLSVTGAYAEVTFHSEDTKIAEVSADGMVTALSLGTTKMVAESADGMRAECTINVLNGVSPKELVMPTQDITMKVGDNTTLNAKVKPQETDQKLTFESSDPSVVRVDKNGYLTALKTGVAVVTVTTTSDAVFKKCMVKVIADNEEPKNNTTITVKGVLYSIAGEKKVNMTVELRNAGGFKRTKTDTDGMFSISDVKQGDYALLVYKTDKDLTPAAKAQLTAGVYNLNVTCIMNDSELVVLYQNTKATSSDIKQLILSAEEIALDNGDTYDMTYRSRPAGAVLPTIVGVSADDSIATVDADGRITGIAKGVTTITFSTLDGKLSAVCKVNVSDANGNQYSLWIIGVETAIVVLCLVTFLIRYHRFTKRREREEFSYDEEEMA